MAVGQTGLLDDAGRFQRLENAVKPLLEGVGLGVPMTFVVALLLFVTPLPAEAQSTARVARIGYLSVASAEFDKMFVAAFREGLGQHGYVEGKNVVVEVRHAAQRLERLPELAAE